MWTRTPLMPFLGVPSVGLARRHTKRPKRQTTGLLEYQGVIVRDLASLLRLNTSSRGESRRAHANGLDREKK